jgi:hypothetical protein
VLAIGLFWILMWLKGGRELLRNLFAVLMGQKTWVGYQKSSLVVKLPNIRDCVFDVSLPFRGTGFESDAALAYARDYQVSRDAWVVWRNLFGKSL